MNDDRSIFLSDSTAPKRVKASGEWQECHRLSFLVPTSLAQNLFIGGVCYAELVNSYQRLVVNLMVFQVRIQHPNDISSILYYVIVMFIDHPPN